MMKKNVLISYSALAMVAFLTVGCGAKRFAMYSPEETNLQSLNKITDKIQIDNEKEKEATTIIKKKSPDVTVQGMGSEKPHNFLNTGSKVTYFL